MTDSDDLKALLARVRRLEDIAELTALIATYGHAADAGAAEVAAGFWTEDGVFDVQPGGRWVGGDEIVEVYRGEGHRHLIEHGCGHMMGASQVEVDGDRAQAWNLSMFVRFDPEADRYVGHRLAANEWKFERRPQGWRMVARTNRLLNGSAEGRGLLENAVGGKSSK